MNEGAGWKSWVGVFFLGVGTTLACGYLTGEHKDEKEEQEASLSKLQGKNLPYEIELSKNKQTRMNRKTEIIKLINFVQSIGNLSSKLVLHRGFHLIDGDYHARPLENTRAAYEIAWVCGIVHCECDIQVSQDDCIFLQHDKTLERFSSSPKDSEEKIPVSLETIDDFKQLGYTKDYNKPVDQLSFLELLKLPLINGARLPLLSEVLESSQMIFSKMKERGESQEYINSKLVIEIKKQDKKDITNFLPGFFEKHSFYYNHVSVFMSFELELLSNLTNKMEKCDVPFLGLLNSPVTPHEWILDEDDICWSPSYDKAEKKLIFLIEKFNLNGAYLEFEESMLKNEKHREIMRKICKKFQMGVWSVLPLSLDMLHDLADVGFEFINTDLEFWDDHNISTNFIAIPTE